MSIKERGVLLIGIIIIVLIFLLFVFFLYRPRIAARMQVNAKIREAQKRISEIRALAREIERLRLKIEELEEENRAFMAKVAPRSATLNLAKTLANEAKRYNVRFVGVRPPGLDTLLTQETPEVPIRPLPLEVTCQGKYLDIGHFIESLANFPFYVKVYELEMTSKPELRPEIEAKLLINIYTSSLVERGEM
jgi:Tfp pilus assembly protein PilO|uniref:Type 4a pilus biogenesis protein PilO n=1 Tax=candidate division WOR-3 bacterium TaxID=2052148 RepID=A0A7C3UQG0_UNCW3